MWNSRDLSHTKPQSGSMGRGKQNGGVGMRAESAGIQCPQKHVDLVKLGLPFFPTFTPISAMSTMRRVKSLLLRPGHRPGSRLSTGRFPSLARHSPPAPGLTDRDFLRVGQRDEQQGHSYRDVCDHLVHGQLQPQPLELGLRGLLQ